MLNIKKAQAGFTLIEVVAAAALLGLLVTMAMPSLSTANARVKNARLKADLATVDQAIQLHLIDKGSLPTDIDSLRPDYLTGTEAIKDAANEALQYTPTGTTYTLTGKDASNNVITSNGSTNAESTQIKTET